MTDFLGIPFYFYRDYRDEQKFYIVIKKIIASLDLIDALFEAAKSDFPGIDKSKVNFISTKDNDPFVYGICFEGDNAPEKYIELKFPIKLHKARPE